MIIQLYFRNELYSLDISNCTTVKDIKVEISRRYLIPVMDQVLKFREVELNDDTQIVDTGITNNDIVNISSKSAQKVEEYTHLIMNTPVEEFHDKYNTNPMFKDAIKSTVPYLEQYVIDNRKEELLSSLLKYLLDFCYQEDDSNTELEATGSMDEESPEMQQRIMNDIHRDNLRLTSGITIDTKPYHIYVITTINNVQVNFVVDTGAQVTTIDLDTAKACYIVRTLNEKQAAEIHGIGKNTSVGAINAFDICIKDEYFGIHSQVMPQDQFAGVCLLGLDFLRLYHGVIDLVNNTLTLEINNKKVVTNLIVGRNIKPLQKIGDDYTEIESDHELETEKKHEETPVQTEESQVTTHNDMNEELNGNHQSETMKNELQQNIIRTAKQLEEMGFSAEDSLKASMEAGGNIDDALAILDNMI